MSGQTNPSLNETRPGLSLAVRRGTLVSLKEALPEAGQLAVVVSNDVQNDISSFISIVPLQRRASRLGAPFAVDLGRQDGLRDLHAVRCDWITRISKQEIAAVERQQLREDILSRIEEAIRIALSLRA